MKKYRNYIIAAIVIIAFCISICFVPIGASKLIPLVETQVSKDLGIKIHIEKLIFRFGPSLKVKAPVMHMMYEDGQKFGQFDNVKFFIPWSSLFKNDVIVKRIYADNLILKVSSNDKYLGSVLEKMNQREFEENPNISLKKYSINYNYAEAGKNYKIMGSNLELDKIQNYKNLKLSTIGQFFINDKQYLSYDLSIVPNIHPVEVKKDVDLFGFLEQLESLDFHSDIIADLKINEGSNGENIISGLVNIDNISVIDKEKKSPKSFIYLTFFGNKTGILSNIYATGDKKVCIEGMVNNSKKPELDLKVKTDKINLEDLYKKVKLIADCSKFKGIDSIKGTLNADFIIKGDINKIKSSGFFNLSDASIKANGIDVNKINSEIDLSNNVITINNAVGYVNNAPIMLRGKIDKNIDLELLMNKVELKHLCPKNFGIKSGVVSLVADINGTFDNIVHKENLLVEKFSAQKNNNRISFDTLKIDTSKENTAYINNVILKPEFTQIIKLPLLKILIDKEFVKIPDTNIFMPNSKLKLKADASNYNNSNFTYNLNLDGSISSKDVKYLKPYLANYPLKISITGNKSVQNVDGQVIMEKAMVLDEPAIVNLSSKIENNALKIDDISISSFKGEFTNNFKNNLKGQKKLIVSGVVENLNNPIFKNIRIFIPQQLNVTSPDTVAQLKGDIFINGKINQPEIVGQLSIQNLINQFLQLAITNLSIDFNKDVAIVNSPMIKLGDSSLGINGTVSTDISKELNVKNITVKSKYLNTDTVLMYKDSPLMKIMPLRVNEGKFYAEKAMMSIYGSQLYLSALTSDFQLKDEVLYARNIASEIFNGKLSGNIDFNLRDESFISKIQARGVSAAPIFDVVSTKKDTVSGIMDFDTNLSGNLSSKQALNGDIKFRVHNGHMGTLGKLEHLLYAQNVISDSMLRTSLSVITKAITLKDTGLFKYLQGDISMKNGIANIKMMQSQGPLMALFIKGQYNPENDWAKLVILGRLSDEVISGLGAFGDFSMNKLMIMLTGEDNKYNIPVSDLDKLPQLPMKNTKEFRSVINGILEKPSSVVLFNWISYSQKSLRQKEVPMDDTKVPDFINSLPY